MMTDMMQFESPEEAREYLRSEWSRTDGSAIERMDNIHELLHSLKSELSESDFKEVVAPLVGEWCNENPEAAQDLVHIVTQLSVVVNEAARGLGLLFGQFTTALDQWARNNPEVVRKLVATLEIFAADGRAAWWRKRYEEEGASIPFDESVRLAICLMVFRIPYGGDRGSGESTLINMYDYEMRAIRALREDRLPELIDGAQSNPLDFQALREALAYLLEIDQPIPSELNDWALRVAAGNVKSPSVGPGRSPYKNEVRDELITKTVRTLVDCGLTATRNEASEPESACDAVSKALKAHGVPLGYAGVAKIWQSDRRQNFSP